MASLQQHSLPVNASKVFITPERIAFDPRYLAQQSATIIIDNQTTERLTYRLRSSHPEYYAVSEPAGSLRDLSKTMITVRLLSTPTELETQYLCIDVLNVHTKQKFISKPIEVKFIERTLTSLRNPSRSEPVDKNTTARTGSSQKASKFIKPVEKSQQAELKPSVATGSSSVTVTTPGQRVGSMERNWLHRNWYALLCMIVCGAILVTPLYDKCNSNDGNEADQEADPDGITLHSIYTAIESLFPPKFADADWWRSISRVTYALGMQLVATLKVTCRLKCFAAFFLGVSITKCLYELIVPGASS